MSRPRQAKVRTPARMLALQALCVYEGLGDDFRDQVSTFLQDPETLADLSLDEPLHEDTLRYARTLADGAWGARQTLDAELDESAGNWSIARMTAVDRNILRIGLYEIEHCPDVPWQAAMDEAIELAKRFGDTRSPAFVNGVLDGARRRNEERRGEAHGAV